MSDITISLSNIHNIKSVFIEELGEFKVRKLGAGEELDLSEKLRRINAIYNELDDIDLSKLVKKNENKTDKEKFKKIQNHSIELMDEINSIKRFEIETYMKCFDDGGTGNTKILFDSLSEADRSNLFKTIFSPTIIEQPPANIDAPVEADRA